MKSYLKITNKMVGNYVHQYGDRNPLHEGAVKIVPGNLITDFIEKCCINITEANPQHFSIKFIKPMYANEKVMIEIHAAKFYVKRVCQEKTLLLACGSWR